MNMFVVNNLSEVHWIFLIIFDLNFRSSASNPQTITRNFTDH